MKVSTALSIPYSRCFRREPGRHEADRPLHYQAAGYRRSLQTNCLSSCLVIAQDINHASYLWLLKTTVFDFNYMIYHRSTQQEQSNSSQLISSQCSDHIVARTFTEFCLMGLNILRGSKSRTEVFAGVYVKIMISIISKTNTENCRVILLV